MWTTQDPVLNSPAPQEVQEAVVDVFADPALQKALTPRGTSQEALANLVKWLWEQYMGLLDGLNDLRLHSPGAYWLTIAALIAVLVLLVWHIVWTFSAAFRGRGPAVDREVEQEVERVLRYGEERRRAAELAAVGEYAEAARTLLLALLALLDERHILRFARGWTNREILRRLERRAEIGAELLEFGATVERASYGNARLGAAEFDRLQAILENIVGQISRAGEPEGAGR